MLNLIRTHIGLVAVSAAAGLLLPVFAGAETPAGATHEPIEQPPAALLDGIPWAVCYSGFHTGQRPGQADPSEAEILEDLRLLSRDGNFRLLRLYDSRENSATALRLIETHRLDVKVLLGAWLGAEMSSPNCAWRKEPYPEAELAANRRANAEEVARAIALANRYPAIVAAVAVGNECLVDWNDHCVPVDAMIGYVRQVKRAVAQPVTAADNFAAWVLHGAPLAREVDFVSVHTYAQWEGKDIGEAMPCTIANLQAVRDALPHSRLAITEAGWATLASEFGPRASEENQRRYYRELRTWAGRMNITTFFFEAFDEDWKGNPSNPLGAEKHWGLFTKERKPKLVVRDLYPDPMAAPVGK